MLWTASVRRKTPHVRGWLKTVRREGRYGGRAISLLRRGGPAANFARWRLLVSVISVMGGYSLLSAPGAHGLQHPSQTARSQFARVVFQARVRHDQATPAAEPCDSQIASRVHRATTSVHNVLVQVRRHYTAVLSLVDGSSYVCIDGTRAGFGITTFRDPEIPPAAATGLLSGTHVARAVGVMYENGRKVVGLGDGGHTYGRTGEGVSAVVFLFAGRRTADAILRNGWYFAWWPGFSAPTGVQWRNKLGTHRSAISCTPQTTGCAFSAAQ